MLILTFETSQRFSEDMAYNQRVIAWGDEEAVQEQEEDNQQEGAEEFSKGPLILTWSCQVL